MTIKSKYNYNTSTKERHNAPKNDPKNHKRNNKQSFLNPSVKFYKPTTGEHKIRILPLEDVGYFSLTEVRVHYGVGPNFTDVFCLSNLTNTQQADVFGTPEFKERAQAAGIPEGTECPLCVQCKRLQNKGIAWDNPVLKPFRTQINYLSYVIDRNAPNDGPKVWSYTKTVFAGLRGLMQKTSGKFTNFDHPIDGYDIWFKKEKNQEGKKIDGRDLEEYDGFELADEKTPMSEDQDQFSKWEDAFMAPENQILNLIELLSPEKIENLYMNNLDTSGVDEDDDTEEDETKDETTSSADSTSEPDGEPSDDVDNNESAVEDEKPESNVTSISAKSDKSDTASLTPKEKLALLKEKQAAKSKGASK
jgi:hypothetical protein